MKKSRPLPSLYVALDVPTAADACRLADQLRPLGVGFKIGMELYYAEGAEVLRRIQTDDNPVFVDLKLHDIPNTVHRALSRLKEQGVRFVNVHAQGGLAMMQAAKEAAGDTITVIGVTLLTSLDETALSQQLKVPLSIRDYVGHLAGQGQLAGLDGVVCSAAEAATLRQACGPDFLLVTPGIRPADAAVGDQKRVVTPQQALRNGANILVVGRPITGDPDPVAATERILADMAGAHA